MAKAPDAPIEDAVERRRLRLRLDGLDDAKRHRRRGLIGLGQTAFGARWRTDLARSIEAHMGRPVLPSQVAHWVSGVRPVPVEIYEACTKIAAWEAAALRRRADVLESGTWRDSLERDDGTVDVPRSPQEIAADAARDRAARLNEDD
ncbi:hypothetical protein [Methylobacterium sp. WL7]|jgi:hypothetical protein|uniref:hypothetical protein n=1 Tax=Methylobacterium sp. WL7 TaxID=2603900 RepID=UPI0011C9BF64|nr:hypothetical protein [Methylobacterium sp. WL7]TXN48444.1 hypothetical protein FV233_01770 [Methylobacterium sp. WL7]